MTEIFISIDVETTGPTPGKYSMYELGACVVGAEEKTFFTELHPLRGATYKQEALHAVGISNMRVILGRKGRAPTNAMARFVEWIDSVNTGVSKVVFIGHNAAFDWMFIAWYLEQFHTRNPFGWSALDMKSYFMGMSKCDWKDASLAHMEEYVGIPHTKLPHRALDDAIIQSRIFARLLKQTRRNI